MIIEFLSRVAEGMASPRRSVRRLLDAGPLGVDTILALVLLSHVVQSMATLAVPDARNPEFSALGWHVRAVIQNVVGFGVSSALVFGVGRLFGGKGDIAACFAAMAWCGLVTSFLYPLLIAGIPTGPEPTVTPLGLLLLFTGVAIGFWVAAGCVAEVHGFASTGSVLGAMIVMVLLTSLVTAVLFPA